MVQEHIDWLNTQIAGIESEIHDHIDGNPDLKHDADLIRSIPGCGSKLAAQFLAYVGDVRRFKNAKSLAAFVGVTRVRSCIERVGSTHDATPDPVSPTGKLNRPDRSVLRHKAEFHIDSAAK
jgi:transposase